MYVAQAQTLMSSSALLSPFHTTPPLPVGPMAEYPELGWLWPFAPDRLALPPALLNWGPVLLSPVSAFPSLSCQNNQTVSLLSQSALLPSRFSQNKTQEFLPRPWHLHNFPSAFPIPHPGLCTCRSPWLALWPGATQLSLSLCSGPCSSVTSAEASPGHSQWSRPWNYSISNTFLFPS